MGAAYLMNGQAKKPEPSKLESTLRARLALKAFELIKLEDGSFLARKWGMCRKLETLADVQAFVVQAGA